MQVCVTPDKTGSSVGLHSTLQREVENKQICVFPLQYSSAHALTILCNKLYVTLNRENE